MNAYDVMHEWDNAVGHARRTDQELDQQIPPLLGGNDYAEWKAALEARHINAIVKGMKIWGLPVEALRPFDLDEAIQTAERPYLPPE